MPAVSEKQRRLMAMAYVAKKRKGKPSSKKVKQVMQSMTLQQLEDYARKPKGKSK